MILMTNLKKNNTLYVSLVLRCSPFIKKYGVLMNFSFGIMKKIVEFIHGLIEMEMIIIFILK